MTVSLRSLPTQSLCALALISAASISFAQTAGGGRFPVTEEQRRAAEQIAQAGVPISELAPNAPDQYTVKRGDTLWGISSIFLKTPWRWPQLWGMNKEQVRNPHLIYPGQKLVLIRGADGMARLQIAGSGDAPSTPGPQGDTAKLSPQVRDAGADRAGAIASIPNNLIEPFLSQPMAVTADELDRYPRIVATPEGRVNLGRNDIAYARGITDESIENYRVLRPARPLYDPDDTNRSRPIAYEAFYLGTARMSRRGEVATLSIVDSKQEIGVGDRLVPITQSPLVSYVPRRPDRQVVGRIVSVYGGVDQAGGNSIVTINRGTRDGLAVGNVLALLETGRTVQDRTTSRNEYVKLPDERIGEMFVFRVFDNISYALIMRVQKPVKVGDRFTDPSDLQLAASTAGAAPAQPQTVSPGSAPSSQRR